jgi:2-haloacid dehalogenase
MIRALAFDVFGTLVDWRGSIIAEGRQRWEPRGIHADWPALADAWRRRYQPSLERVRSGAAPWTPLDALHRSSLDQLLPEFGLGHLGESDRRDLNAVWHRLRAWPDVRAGLEALNAGGRQTATLSNGNLDLLRDLAAANRLPFTRILSAETFHAYKPDPRTYLGAARELGLEPGELMMTAAHVDDLRAARSHGLRTAFIARPQEWGPGAGAERPEPGEFDYQAATLAELAQLLGRTRA